MSMVVLAVSTFFYVNEPVVAMREQPSAQSEVVSGSYYSEQVKVLEESGDWFKIQTCVDSYEGWVPKKVVYTSARELFKNPESPVAKVSRTSALIYHMNDTIYGPILRLPFESQLEVIDSSDKRWITVRTVDGSVGYIQRGEVALDTKICTLSQMLELSELFVNLPYVWGGRSGFGYDCSGFVQMLYRQMGIFLPRDSKDQMNDERFSVVSFNELKPGDLIFWGVAEDKIRHVGLYLGNNEFINATVKGNKPWIHKCSLLDPGWNGDYYPYRTFRALRKD